MFYLISLVCGILFGIGLSLSGMTDPLIVLGFLDIIGQWNPSLLFVMIGAVATTFLGYRLVLRRDKPIYESIYDLPKKTGIDKKLILGATLFGAGWGLLGLCPGPAIASLSSLQPKVFGFVVSMMVGMIIFEKMDLTN